MADKIKEKWEALFFEASEVDHNLGGTKKMFTEVVFVIKLTKKKKKKEEKQRGKQFKLCSLQITKQQIEDYTAKVADFFSKFMAEGPGAVGEDLDKGK